MTEKQSKRFYFPLWQQVCKANSWRMQDGRLELAEDAQEPANTVLSAARLLAEQEHRAVTIDDLRHATHVVAWGRDCSHKNVCNRELTRWSWLAKLLIDPDDLDAMNHWEHPCLDEQESFDARISKVPAAVVTSICRNAFGSPDWRGLDPYDKRKLVIILAKRNRNFRKPFEVAV